jgi:hypothetical protein
MIAFGAIVIVRQPAGRHRLGPEGPKSGFFPFYLGVVDHRGERAQPVHGDAQDPRKIFADWSQLDAVLSVVIPTAIYVSAIPFVGIYVSSLLLIAAFMMWFGRYGIGLSAAVSVGVVVAVYLMFEKWFLVPLPKGPIEDFFQL